LLIGLVVAIIEFELARDVVEKARQNVTQLTD